MPLYEYECGACGHRFEKIVKYSDPPIKKCPKCKGKVRKLASAPAIQFKGAGWYITDYASKSTKDEKEKKAGEDKKGADEKPAKKDEKAAPASSSTKPSKKKGSED